jgi:hypothetical protein
MRMDLDSLLERGLGPDVYNTLREALQGIY